MADVSFSDIVRDQTSRSLWSLRNVINCVTDGMWDAHYCGTPVYQHIYHTLHSLDRWYTNPFDYTEPDIHTDGLNDLNAPATAALSRDVLNAYASRVEAKILAYAGTLNDAMLAQKPDGCAFARFTLILAQHRHLDMHIGMLMGFVIAETGRWPKALGLYDEIAALAECEYD